jgi:N-acetylmuramoyl-L-alanine amidase
MVMRVLRERICQVHIHMRRRVAAVLGLLLCVGVVFAQVTTPYQQHLEFRFADRAVLVPQVGTRVEIMPVLTLMGAQSTYSPAAQTYAVVYGDDIIQFALERRYILVNGALQEAPDTPVPSPGGVAASLPFLDRALLAPMGYHLEPFDGGYQIVAGAHYADPVAVLAAAADFDATTTLMLTVNRAVEVTVEEPESGGVIVHFVDAAPRLDTAAPLRSSRVRRVTSVDRDLRIELAGGVGLLSWHQLENPPRIIVELGKIRAKPTPAAAEAFGRQGQAPIVIDPGHGGDDHGAISRTGVREKDLVLAIARQLASALASRGHVVRLTRAGDESRALTDRAALANRLEASVFVSLHANASTAAAAQGAETYYMSLDESATDAHAAATADLENRAVSGGGPRSPLDLILWDLAQAAVLNESAELALAVQTRLNEQGGRPDRGVKQAPFVVLTGATMPAILVEVGFLSNQDEARQLENSDHQRRLADAIAFGIDDFVRKR